MSWSSNRQSSCTAKRTRSQYPNLVQRHLLISHDFRLYRFLSDRYVEGTCPKCSYAGAKGDQCESCANPLDPLELISPKCTLCGTQPETKETVHQSIRLDKLQERLEQWSKESIAKGKWSSNAVAMTNSWLRDGLKPRNITRDLEWGVPVPLKGWEKKVMYVWVGRRHLSRSYAQSQVSIMLLFSSMRQLATLVSPLAIRMTGGNGGRIRIM